MKTENERQPGKSKEMARHKKKTGEKEQKESAYKKRNVDTALERILH